MKRRVSGSAWTLIARALLLVLCLTLAGSCRRGGAAVENPQIAEAEDYLVRYLRIDTSNPPGNETAGARFLHDILSKEGIEASLVGSNPNRQSVYARLKSGTNAPALLLLHHIDVVPATPSQWTVPPFAGQRSGGYIWGRGALDVKSLGIANLMALLDLKRSGARLTRDVIFLAVADEEGGGKDGCVDLLTKSPELFSNVGFVLNEGGGNETIVDQISFWGIEIDQKVPLWLRLDTRGMAGHGAVPPDDGGSAVRLIEALNKVRELERPYRLTSAVARYFRALAPKKPGMKGQVLRDPAKYFETPALQEQLSSTYRALLRDTIAITRLAAGDLVNSIPAAATAELDMRLLPDTDPAAALSDIRSAVGEAVTVSVILQGTAAPPSSTDTELFRVLTRVMTRAEPNSIVGPSVSAGTSDSRFFRARGMVAYGISPFKVNYYDANTVHGVDERIRARFFAAGITVMRDIVREFCVAKADA